MTPRFRGETLRCVSNLTDNKMNNTIKILCVECEIIEVNDLLAICDSCFEKRKHNREKQIIKDAEEVIEKIYSVLFDNSYTQDTWKFICQQEHKNKFKAFKTACYFAIISLEFSKQEFEKSIGALILDGAFESENDSGVGMLRLYIRDYEKQIEYITKTYING